MDIRVFSKGQADTAAGQGGRLSPRWLVVIAMSLALIAGGAAYIRCGMVNTVLYSDWGYGTDEASGPRMADTWFTSDITLVSDLMSDRWSGSHYRTSRHPLMSIALYPPVKAMLIVGVPKNTALRIMTAGVAAAWTALLFFFLIVWGCRAFDAVVFTALAGVSASAMFWFAIPEIFSYGSLTILAALLLTMWPARVPPLLRHTAALTVSFSITVTNIIVGLIGAVRSLSLKNLWIAGTSAFFIVTMLWAVGRVALFPFSDYFLPPADEEFATNNSLAPTPGRIFLVIESILAATMVMPRIDIMRLENNWIATVQHSMAWGGGVASAIATTAWIALLGLAAATARQAPAGMWRLCALSLGAMIVFHSVFGNETFLYALHFLPLLIVMAAAVTFTRWRRTGLALAVVVMIFGGVNNWNAFQAGASFTQEVEEWARTFPGATPPP